MKHQRTLQGFMINLGIYSNPKWVMTQMGYERWTGCVCPPLITYVTDHLELTNSQLISSMGQFECVRYRAIAPMRCLLRFHREFTELCSEIHHEWITTKILLWKLLGTQMSS